MKAFAINLYIEAAAVGRNKCKIKPVLINTVLGNGENPSLCQGTVEVTLII